MAFGIAFAYDTGSNRRLKICDTSLNLLYTGTIAMTNVYVAADRVHGVVYVCESNVLKGRSATDGSLLYTEFESIGAQRPIFVDKDRYVWTLDNTNSKYLYKWSYDLSARTTYTLKTGNFLQDAIQYITPTIDSNYLYILGGTNTGRIAKYTMTNLNGGDPDWTYDTSLTAMRFLCTDSDNSVYITGESANGGRLIKVNSSGSSIYGTVYGHGSIIAQTGSKIFTWTTNGDTKTAGCVKQLLSSNGTYVGRTQTVVNPLDRSIHLYDDTILFAGHYESEYGGNQNGIYKFSIASDLGEGDVATASILYAEKDCYAYGDATGWINRQFYSFTASDLDIYNNTDSSFRTVEHDNNRSKLVISESNFIYTEQNGVMYLRPESKQVELVVHHKGLNT